MTKLLNKHWHHLPESEVIDLLDAQLDTGLDNFEIEERRQTYGVNTLTIKKEKSPLLRFLLQFHQALVYILFVAIGIKLYLGGWVDASVILGVVVLNAIIGFIQESKALTALAALSHTLVTEAIVLRAKEKQHIDAKNLVPGDIVLLQSGDKVPADIRLLRSRELQIDESTLTGESMPVRKVVSVLEHDTLLADRTNMLYSSTLVTYGTGLGIVIATGDDTEIGCISQLITSAEILETPLTRKIAKFSHILLIVILGLAAITFLFGLWHGDSWESLFMASVALSVAMIPEGLPAVMTITLAIGVSRMAKRHAIIRHLPAVETLGSTTVICSDKTGTLTCNEMTVQQLWVDNQHFEVSGIGYTPYGSISLAGQEIDVQTQSTLLELLYAGLLCNGARLKQTEKNWDIEGDPTEGALLVSAHKAGLDIQSLIKQRPRHDAIAFESQHQYMATLHSSESLGERVIYLKGSVESLLQRSNISLGRKGEHRLLDQAEIHRQVEIIAKQGLRVLAFARLVVPMGTEHINHDTVASGLEFIGLQGMIDPPREEATKAIAACRTAGIEVKMITGDHSVTAAAIASQLGLTDDTAIALNGRDLEDLFDTELIQAASTISVFARVTPEQKLRLVEALQAKGEVVAMTGDGVNDAPALRKANIGVAMGITGTEVAKEAADMVLTNDNFSTIEAAVEEGRGVLDNLIKFLSFILATNFGEGLVIMAAVLTGETLPVLPVQALWINMTAAVFLGLTLAFEPREPGLMTKPPRPPSMPILKGELIFRIFLVGIMLLIGSFGLFEWGLHHGASVEQARTIAINVFAVGESFYLLNCRSLRHSMFRLGLFSNLWIWGGIFLMIMAQLAFTYLPLMNQLFHTAPISLNDWLHIIAVGFIIHIVIALDKAIRLWLERSGALKN